jgi:hypothetical protein
LAKKVVFLFSFFFLSSPCFGIDAMRAALFFLTDYDWMVIVLTWLYELLGFKIHGIDDVVPRHMV